MYSQVEISMMLGEIPIKITTAKGDVMGTIKIASEEFLLNTQSEIPIICDWIYPPFHQPFRTKLTSPIDLNILNQFSE